MPAQPRPSGLPEQPMSPKVASLQQRVSILIAQGYSPADALKAVESKKMLSQRDYSANQHNGQKPVKINGIYYPSVTEAAKALGITTETLRRRRKAGKLNVNYSV